MSRGKHIKTLERRRDHLRKRFEEDPRLTYDRTECLALEWVLAIVNPSDRKKGGIRE